MIKHSLKIDQLSLVVFDFDGVFTDNHLYVSQNGTESIRCYRGDGLGLARLKSLGIEIVIISTEVNPVVSVRAEKLGIPCIQGCEDKLEVLKTYATELGVDLSQVAFVGNDINDRSCLKSVNLPVVVADAAEEIFPLAEIVLKKKGGEGAVREFCDMVWNVRKELGEVG